MSWPTRTDYQSALQDPEWCLTDPELKCGKLLSDRDGFPIPLSGGYACVFQLTSRDGRKWAVRCFLNPFEYQSRYAALHDFLRKHPLPYMAEFTYLSEGIYVDDKPYPILKMEWVEGKGLNTYIKEILKEPAELSKLSESWLAMARDLRNVSIAHCDLHHDNVLITEAGRLKLVDYDDLFIPALRGKERRSRGLAAYQHPGRLDTDYNELTDRFPLLSIYLSILAITHDQSFIERHKGLGSEHMLFQEKDYLAPEKSDLFSELCGSDNELVRKLALELKQACNGNIDDVPDLLRFTRVIYPATHIEPAPSSEISKGDDAGTWSIKYHRRWQKPAFASKMVKIMQPIYEECSKEEVTYKPVSFITRIFTGERQKRLLRTVQETVQVGEKQTEVHQPEVIPGKELRGTSLAFSAGSQYLFVGSNYGAVYQWDIASGDVVNENQELYIPIERLYAKSNDGIYCNSQYCISSMYVPDETILHCVRTPGILSPDHRLLVRIDSRALVLVKEKLTGWMGQTPKEIIASLAENNTWQTIVQLGNKDEFDSANLAFSLDSALLVSLTSHGKLSIWDTTNGQKIQENGIPAGSRCIALKPDNSVLAIALGSGDILLWDMSQHCQVGRISETIGRADCIAFSAYGNMLAYVTDDGKIGIYDLEMVEEENPASTAVDHAMDQLSDSEKDDIPSEDISPIDIQDLCIPADETELVEPFQYQVKWRRKGQEQAFGSLAFSQDSQFLFAGTSGGLLYKWDADSGEIVKKDRISDWEIERIYTTGDNTIKCSAQVFSPMTILNALGERSTQDKPLGILSPNDRFAVTLEEAKLVYFHVLGQTIPWRIGVAANVASICFSPNSEMLVLLSSNGTLLVWDTAGKRTVLRSDRIPKGQCISLHPDNNILAIAGANNDIVLWDISKKNVINVVRGMDGATDCLAFSRNGEMLAYGSHDGNIGVFCTKAVQVDTSIKTGFQVIGMEELRYG